MNTPFPAVTRVMEHKHRLGQKVILRNAKLCLGSVRGLWLQSRAAPLQDSKGQTDHRREGNFIQPVSHDTFPKVGDWIWTSSQPHRVTPGWHVSQNPTVTPNIMMNRQHACPFQIAKLKSLKKYIYKKTEEKNNNLEPMGQPRPRLGAKQCGEIPHP